MHPDPNLESPREDPIQGSSQTVSEGEESTASGIPPGIRRANEAFRRDLPELLKNTKLYRRWVAYHEEERIGIARDPGALYEECERRGLKQEQFTVRCIIPEMEDCDGDVFFPE